MWQKIKVGQIREWWEKLCVITLDDNGTYHVIFQNGETGHVPVRQTFLFSETIAEYPTWQEAVNSPEFRGEKKEQSDESI